MKTLAASLTLLIIGAISWGFSHTDSPGQPGSPEVAQVLASARSTDGTITPEAAESASNVLLGLLAASPRTPERDFQILEALTFTLPAAGRRDEAVPLLEQACERDTNLVRKLLYANHAIALVLQGSGNHPDDAEKQRCRAVASVALAAVPPITALAAAGEWGIIVSAMPLHHVVASTQGTPSEALASLSELIDTCSAVAHAAASAGVENPVEMDHYNMAVEATKLFREINPAATPSESLEFAMTLPWDGPTPHTATSIVDSFVAERTISMAERRTLIESVRSTLPSTPSLKMRHNLEIEDAKSYQGTTNQAMAGSAVQRVSGLLQEIVAAEEACERGEPCDLPGGTAGLRQMALNLLLIKTELCFGVLGDHAAGAAAAAEYVRRKPDGSPSASMRRLAQRAQ